MRNIVRFECFEVDLDSGQLRRHGVKLKLRDQSFQVLVSLLEHPGRVVTREELRQRLWRNEVFVDFDNNLNIVIARLREALGDSTEHPRFIETLPKHGYRFLAAVSQPVDAAEALPARRAKLLVLPFVNFGGDPAQEWMAEAVMEEIITELASLPPEHLAVIARTTAMRCKRDRKDVTSIGRELGVDYVVEGALRHSEDRVAITVQLIRASDQTHLFARKYETSRDDIFNTPARAASDLAVQVGVTLRQSRQAGATGGARSGRRRAPDPVAYKEYLHARSTDKTTAESLAEAKQHLESAISRDPEFAAAYDALAETYWHLGYFGFLRPRDAFAAGILHAVRALEIDETRAETHALLGQFHKTTKYDWREVRREMTRARQLDPASPIVKLRYAVSDLMPHGRIKEAIDELEWALELDPLSLLSRSWLSVMLVFAGDYERANGEALRALEVEPTYWPAYLAISACQRYRGNSREAIEAQRRCVELSGNAASMLGWLGLTLAAGGETTEACAVLQRLRDMAAKRWVPPTSFALIHLGLREIDTAFEWLNRGVDECDQLMMPIKSYPFLHPIRADARFAALLRKMNLEP